MEFLFLLCIPASGIAAYVGAYVRDIKNTERYQREAQEAQARIVELEDELNPPAGGPERVRWHLRVIRSHRQAIESERENNNG